MIPLKLEKIIQFDDISTTWNLIQVSLDWDCRPLLLFEEGRPPFRFVASEERARWCATAPSANHIVYFENDRPMRVTVPNSIGAKVISLVQRFEDNWLLVESRGGNAHLYSGSGIHLKSFDLGDAINDVQTTADGKIWVSYFDEGVFGSGIGANGLVCFDSEGRDIFRFAEFAEKQNLPHIDDCYALNVASEDVWISYYSDFPLVQLKDFRLTGLWNELACLSDFAVRKDAIVALPCEREKIVEIDLATRLKRDFDPADDLNGHLVDFKGAARGAEMFLYTETALFRIP